jgi:hypothetical protein
VKTEGRFFVSMRGAAIQGVQGKMSPKRAVQSLWQGLIARLGAEEYSVILALVVIVGLTAMTAMKR